MANIPDNIRAAIECLLEPYGLEFELVQSSSRTGKRYLDVRSAVTYSSLSRWTLSRADKLPQIKIGAGKTGKILYDINDLDKFLSSHKKNTNTRSYGK